MADEGAAAPRPLRVLVVDSHSQSRKAAVGLLELCDYKVTAVATAKEALALLSLDPLVPTFDLLLKDHHPAAGVNACRMLVRLKSTPWAKLPVVVCSDQDSRTEVLKCFNLGAADYLVKPLRQNEIRNLWTRVPVLVALFSKGRAGPCNASQDFPETDPAPGVYESSPTDSADTSGLDDNLMFKEVSTLIADRNDHSQQQDSEKVGAGSNGDTTTSAQAAFQTNLYSAGPSYPAAHCSLPILPRLAAHHNGSGEGNTTGSGQGSGSGNQISQSAAGWDEALGSQAPASKGRSSIGNGSAVGNGACDSGSVAHKRQAEQQPISSSEIPCCGDSAFQAERPAPDSSAAADASRGFRAWIRPMHTSSPAQASEYEQPLISLALSRKLSDSMQLPALGALPATPMRTWSNAAAASSRLVSGGTGTGLSTATRMVHAAHCSSAPASTGVDSVDKGASLGRISAPQPEPLQQQQQRVVHVQQQEQHMQQLRQQEASATAPTQVWAAAPAAQAQMQRLQHHVNSQMLANFAQGGGGGVLPHMLAHGLNPFAFHMPSSGPVSRDDMPLPYGEHHLMQAGAQRMQAQQQAAAAKQAEMQQQLGAAMLASYPGYLPSPFGRVGFPGIQSPSCWPVPRNPVQQQQQQQQQQQNQHGLHQYAHPPQFAQSAPNRMPLSAALLPAGSAHLMSGHLPGPGQHLHSYPSASTLVCSGVLDSAGCRPECCTPSGALGGMSTDGRPSVSAATNLTSATTGGGSMGGELSQKERRAQALYKYKQKRKNLCFTKKIRYESRKQLAQARPRIKGQFVRVPVGGSEAALGSGELLDAAVSLESMPEEDVSGTFTADMGTANDEVALGSDVMADEDVQEYGRIGSESEKSIGVLEDGPHAVEEVAQDCSPVTAAIEDTSQLPCQRAVKGHRVGVSQPSALHVAAGGVASKHHTVHVTSACAQAARQAKANAAEARRNGSDRGSNSPDEDGTGQDI